MVRTKKLNPLDWDPDVVLNRKPDFDLEVKCLSWELWLLIQFAL